MTKYLSTGVSMAWQLAARIAGSLKHEFIEKEHVFVGIFSLDKLVEQGQTAESKKKVDISLRSQLALEDECSTLQELLDDYRITFEQLRKNVLVQMKPGTSTQTEDVIHRSDHCKAIFTRAEQMAKLAGASFSCLHLLSSLMEVPGNIIDNALEELRILPHQLKQKIINTAGRKNVYATTFDNQELNTCYMFPQAKKDEPVTILAGKVAGSKNLIEELGELQLCCLLEDRNQLISGIIDRHNKGEIVKSVEQGLLIVFSSPMDAVESACELQNSIPGHDDLQMGLGIDRGVIKRQESGRAVEVSGEPVSLARKMAKAAKGGDILASEDVVNQVGATSSENVTWEPAGTCTSESGDKPVKVYKKL